MKCLRRARVSWRFSFLYATVKSVLETMMTLAWNTHNQGYANSHFGTPENLGSAYT